MKYQFDKTLFSNYTNVYKEHEPRLRKARKNLDHVRSVLYLYEKLDFGIKRTSLDQLKIQSFRDVKNS